MKPIHFAPKARTAGQNIHTAAYFHFKRWHERLFAKLTPSQEYTVKRLGIKSDFERLATMLLQQKLG